MKKSEERKEKSMHYSVQPNEIAGFIYFLSKATPNQRQAWIDKYPELKKTDFESFSELMTKPGPSISGIYDFIGQINSLEDLKKMLDGYPGKDIDINKMKQTLDSVWPIYDKFYQEQIDKLTSISKDIDRFMNQQTINPLKNVAKFFDYKLKDFTITAYTIPVTTGKKESSQRGGWYQDKEEIFTWFDSDRPPKFLQSVVFHETTHMLFYKSGKQKFASQEYRKNNSLIIKHFEENPQLKKLSGKKSGADAADWLLNESLATAFQSIFEKDILGLERKDLYGNHPILNAMAHKTIPLLREALKNGETFGPEFMKKFEKEFEMAIPEIEKEITPKQEKAPIMARLSEATKEGKNDPRNQVNTTQENTEKKTVFPKWLQNPSWLWHKNKQQ